MYFPKDSVHVDKSVLKALDQDALLIHGPERLQLKESDLVVLCTLKDAEFYVQEFIDHYLSLGATHIVFLDTGSRDATLEILKRQPKHVSVFQTTVPFKDNYVSMSQFLIYRFGMESWSLVADIDEFFEFPFTPGTGMPELLAYLSQNSYTAMTVHMLDMFSDAKLKDFGNVRGTSMKTRFPYYDLTDIVRTDDPYRVLNQCADPEIRFHLGGIRGRHFDLPKLHISKHPLAFYKNSDMYFIDCHFIAGARIADVSGVFLHFKFSPDFWRYVEDSIRQGNHWRESLHYKRYAAALETNPDATLMTSSTAKYENVNQLVEQRFLKLSERYLRFTSRTS